MSARRATKKDFINQNRPAGPAGATSLRRPLLFLCF